MGCQAATAVEKHIDLDHAKHVRWREFKHMLWQMQ